MQSNKLKNKMWVYLVGFSVIILVFLWLFQVIFLDTYYEYNVSRQLTLLSKKILNTGSNSLIHELDDIAHDYGVCIELFSNNSLVYSSNSFNKGCLGTDNFTFYEYKNKFISGDETTGNYVMINPKFDNKTLIKAIKVNNYSIFINASLEPLDATIGILASQLILVSGVVLALSVLVAYIISQKLSKPIININNMAKEISKGNYKVMIPEDSEIEEINNLAITLNNTAKELSKTETLRRELMANVSHDLRTPLTMIKAYAEMIKDVTHKDKKKMDNNLDVIIEETDRLNILVDDILELSKIQTNTDEIVREEFDLDELIKTILNRYDILVANEQYQFIYSSPENIKVVGNKKRIEQILYNLINNAIQYTGNDKKVTINVLSEQNFIKIEIKDTGKGISKEEMKYIWDKYYKIDKSYQRNHKSSGIGLSIVKSLCIQNDIEYGVISKKNYGSCFWIKIGKD